MNGIKTEKYRRDAERLPVRCRGPAGTAYGLSLCRERAFSGAGAGLFPLSGTGKSRFFQDLKSGETVIH